MKGKLIHFNGILGSIIGEDNVKYTAHIAHFNFPESHWDNMQKKLSKANRNKPIAVEFDYEDRGDKYKPLALNIKILKVPNWTPQFTPTGFWLPLDTEETVFRCSSCGVTNSYKTKFCPHCGVPMTRIPDENGYHPLQSNFAKHATIATTRLYTITMAVKKAEEHVAAYLRTKIKNSEDLTVSIQEIATMCNYTGDARYSLSVFNITKDDVECCKELFQERPAHKINGNFAFSLSDKTSEKTIIESIFHDNIYYIDRYKSDNTDITFWHEFHQQVKPTK